jgi:hypothetical protein
MKKWIALLLSIFTLIFFVGCSSTSLEKPETNLEFWIAENVDGVDFSAYQEKHRYGYMGPGRLYYGTDYQPTVDEEGRQVDPEIYVIYNVSPYPDHSSKKQHITGIDITDPSIVVYGLTVNSTEKEIEETMKNNGFDAVALGNNQGLEWVKDKYHFSFFDGHIYANVEVSNFWKIQY